MQCKHISRVVSIVVAILGMLTGVSTALSAEDERWTGTGKQKGGQTWSIEIIRDGDKYSVRYPSLNCVGMLTVKKNDNNSLLFEEKITSGKCVSGGTLWVNLKTTRSANFLWYYPPPLFSFGGTKPKLGATGTLELKERRDLAKNDAMSSDQLVQDVQKELIRLGFDPGPADGRYGRRTRSAIEDYQRSHGITVDGQVTTAILAQVQRDVVRQDSRSSTVSAAKPTQVANTGSNAEIYPAPYRGTWVTDRQGCQLNWPVTLRPDVTILWTGACQNNKASGDGIVEVYQGARKTFLWEYVTYNGLTWRDGHINLTLDRKRIRMKIIYCGKEQYSKYETRSVVAFVPSNWEIGNGIVSDFIFNELNKFANQKCPILRFSEGRRNTDLSITTAGKGKQETLATCGYGGNPEKALSCSPGWTQNYSARRLNQRVAQKIRAENAQIAERARSEQLARQQAAESAREAARNARAQALADRFQPTTWIPWGQVRSNPFAYEGKVFLVNTKFTKMLTRDTALFGGDPFFGAPVIFVDVPKTAFVGSKEVIVVGKVLDSDPSKNPPGVSGTVLRMEYLAHEFCAEVNCKDYGKVVSR